jgi:hypothetical protein
MANAKKKATKKPAKKPAKNATKKPAKQAPAKKVAAKKVAKKPANVVKVVKVVKVEKAKPTGTDVTWSDVLSIVGLPIDDPRFAEVITRLGADPKKAAKKSLLDCKPHGISIDLAELKDIGQEGEGKFVGGLIFDVNKRGDSGLWKGGLPDWLPADSTAESLAAALGDRATTKVHVPDPLYSPPDAKPQTAVTVVDDGYETTAWYEDYFFRIDVGLAAHSEGRLKAYLEFVIAQHPDKVVESMHPHGDDPRMWALLEARLGPDVAEAVRAKYAK